MREKSLILFFSCLVSLNCIPFDVCLSSLHLSDDLERSSSQNSLLPSFNCERGHWPLQENSCHSSEIGISINLYNNKNNKKNNSLEIFSHASLPSDLISSWKITKEINFTSKCLKTIENVIFVSLPYDREFYQSDGSNFYVIHVDIIIPLWNYHIRMKDQLSTPIIVIFPFNAQNQRDITSNHLIALQDVNKYWIKSIQILFDSYILVPGTNQGISTFISNSFKQNLSYYSFSSSSPSSSSKLENEEEGRI